MAKSILQVLYICGEWKCRFIVFKVQSVFLYVCVCAQYFSLAYAWIDFSIKGKPNLHINAKCWTKQHTIKYQSKSIEWIPVSMSICKTCCFYFIFDLWKEEEDCTETFFICVFCYLSMWQWCTRTERIFFYLTSWFNYGAV